MAKLNIYGCGGTGINIVSSFVKFHNKKDNGFAEINTYFLDTSDSNTIKDTDSSLFYKIESTDSNGKSTDGSGKKRDTNLNLILESAKEMLLRFKPASVNLIVHSASGGSGSVIGPVLVRELLERNELVVVLLVGTTDSRIETENTTKTLKTYESISQVVKKPVPCTYRENKIDYHSRKVDEDIKTMIAILSAMFSGENSRLDSADLNNFLNYNRVTDYQSKLTLLDFFSKEISLSRGLNVMSLVSLTTKDIDYTINIPVEYRTDGIMPDCLKDAFNIEMPLHVCMINGYFNNVIDSLEQKLKMYNETKMAVIEKSIVKDTDIKTAGFIVV